MDLFAVSAKTRQVGQPLAERLRPTTLEQVVGQEHLLGAGRLLAQIATAQVMPSMILWGPPGSGKTTLAQIVARQVGAQVETLSAVEAGVRDIRRLVGEARERRDQFHRSTVLFVDEIHRFSKSQQDALLPHVEAGTVSLIGATTENPSFSINAPLLSRCRVVVLEQLGERELDALLSRCLTDSRGFGDMNLCFADGVRDALIAHSNGDARRLLNSLEVAVSVACRDPSEPVRVTLAIVEEALQYRTLTYDKSGDEHYGVISAFIKSLRGTDPGRSGILDDQNARVR